MRIIDRIIMASIAVECVLFFAVRSYQSHHSNSQATTIVHASHDLVVGALPNYEGLGKSPYTLVEFGDYQCPPCAAAYSRAQQLLKDHGSKLNMVFRHYPLPMHSLAMNAAILAEEAEHHGVFWKMHAALYQLNTRVDEPALDRLKSQYHLARKTDAASIARDRAAIAADHKAGDEFGVEGTPSFFLCCPDGRVLKLRDLDVVPSLLE